MNYFGPVRSGQVPCPECGKRPLYAKDLCKVCYGTKNQKKVRIRKMSDDLIIEYIGYSDILSWNACKKINLTSSFDEIRAIGRVGLVKAARKYDCKKGAAFRSYAYHRIRGEIMDWIRKERGKGLKGSVFKSASDLRVEMVDITAVGLSIDGLEGRCIDKNLAAAVMKILPSSCKRLFKQYYFDDMPMSEIAKLAGCTESNISLKHKKALAMVSKMSF